MKFRIVFKNSDSCFYVKCVADAKDDHCGECSTSLTTPIEPYRDSNKKKKTKSDFNLSKIKIVRCDEEGLDNINAALLSAENLLKMNAPNHASSTERNQRLSQKEAEALICEEVNDNVGYGKTVSKTSTNQNVFPKDILEVTLNDNSYDVSKTDDALEISLKNVNEPKNKLSNSLHSTLPMCTVSCTSTVRLKRKCKPSTSNYISKLKHNVTYTAYLAFPSVLDKNVDVSFIYISSNDNIRRFILNGEMIKSNDEYVKVYNPTEIDKVVDDIIIFGTHYYLIKWKTWSQGFNTWECFGVLRKAQKLIYDYALKRKNNVNESRPINVIHLMLSRQVISQLFDLFRNQSGLSLPLVSPDDLSHLYNNLSINHKQIQILQMKSFKWNLRTIALNNYRQQQLVRLKLWELDINVMTIGYKIKVENNTDLEGPPDFFVYTSKYVPSANIVIPDDPPIGCSCKKNCASSIGCCSEMSGYSVAYDMNKIMMKEPGYPIYECNKRCKCTLDCRNRVVQLGSKLNVCIYKTRTCGWGVKTNLNIKKGQFVAKYVGEIITFEESELRLEKNTSLIDYMWNLDFDDSQNYKYTIDGTHFANFTYFINHSCSANLNVYAVWINCLDRNLPELALFAGRDIFAGEQLTTNYFTRTSKDALKKSGIRCQCNMKYCKGYYF